MASDRPLSVEELVSQIRYRAALAEHFIAIEMEALVETTDDARAGLGMLMGDIVSLTATLETLPANVLNIRPKAGKSHAA